MGAHMIPPSYDVDYESSGEELVFATLRDEAPDDWIVLHGLDIAPNSDVRRGEADFVVLIPDQGAVVLEVKSKASQDAERLWHFGRNVTSTRSPFQQSDKAMRSILKYLDSQRFERRPFFCSCVVTPFGDITTRVIAGAPVEWNEWQAIGQTLIARHGLVNCIRRCMTRERDAEGRALTPFSVTALRDSLRPQFEFHVSPAARRRRLEEELKRYTEEQFDALDDFYANGQLLIEGPAGCGKTLIALEVARREVRAGRSVLLVCYNRLLGDWLARQGAALGPNAVVATLDKFMLEVSGLRVRDDRAFWEQDLPLTAASRFSDSIARFDVVVVDEAQDLMTDARLMFLGECVEGGLAGGRWLFCGDFDSQAIHVSQGADAARSRIAAAICHPPAVRMLRRNCRNTPPIAEFAERAAGASGHELYRSYLRGGGQPPQLVECAPDKRTPVLASTLEDLRTAGYEWSEIVVLSGCGADKSSAARLSADPVWRDRLSLAGDERVGVGYESIWRFKGLESAIVVLTDLEAAEARKASFEDLVYVAVTRSTENVHIIATRETLRSFEPQASR